MIPKKAKDLEPYNINLQITKKCNFNCTYCYEFGMHRDESSQLDTVDGIVKLANNIYNDLGKKISLTFIGGEPTLNSEFARVVQKAIYDEGLLDHIIVITNGWSVDAVEGFFHPDIPKEKIIVQVSYDGKIIADKYRLRGNKGTADEVLENFLELAKKGYHKVVTKSTIPMNELHYVPDIIEEFKNISKDMGTQLVYAITEDFTTTYNDFTSWEDNAEYVQKSFQKILEKEIEVYNEFGFAITKWFIDYSHNANRGSCSAGYKFININESGDLQFCHHVDYTADSKKDLEYGNIKDEDIWDRLKVVAGEIKECINDQTSECSSCKALYCVKCPIANYAVTKDKNRMHGKHADEFKCHYFREISKYIYVFDKMKAK